MSVCRICIRIELVLFLVDSPKNSPEDSCVIEKNLAKQMRAKHERCTKSRRNSWDWKGAELGDWVLALADR